MQIIDDFFIPSEGITVNTAQMTKCGNVIQVNLWIKKTDGSAFISKTQAGTITKYPPTQNMAVATAASDVAFGELNKQVNVYISSGVSSATVRIDLVDTNVRGVILSFCYLCA